MQTNQHQQSAGSHSERGSQPVTIASVYTYIRLLPFKTDHSFPYSGRVKNRDSKHYLPLITSATSSANSFASLRSSAVFSAASLRSSVGLVFVALTSIVRFCFLNETTPRPHVMPSSPSPWNLSFT